MEGQPHPEHRVARRRRRWLRRALVTLGVGALAAYSPWLWVSAQSAGRVHEPAEAPSAPVTLVLGAGLNPDGTPSPFLAGRLDVAKALLDAGRTKVLLVSGDNRYLNYDEPTSMRDYLVAKGVPAELVIRDFAGRDTYDSCARARRIFGVERALVVSQAYHLPRAVATCRAVGIDAEGVGDRSAAVFAAEWSSGEVRERGAAVKTVWDVLTRRDPVLGQPETGVTDALARS